MSDVWGLLHAVAVSARVCDGSSVWPFGQVLSYAKRLGFCTSGDLVVVMTGEVSHFVKHLCKFYWTKRPFNKRRCRH
jgi:hypothetical protein